MKIENGKLMINAGQMPTLRNRASGVPCPGDTITRKLPHSSRGLNHARVLEGPGTSDLYDWLERRLQLEEPIKDAVLHPVPKSTASWWYVFGSASLRC